MRKRSRVRRVAKWVGLVTALLFFAAWAISLVVAVFWKNQAGTLRVDVSRGAVCVQSFGTSGFMLSPGWDVSLRVSLPKVVPRYSRFNAVFPLGIVVSLIIPLWIPFLAVALPVTIIWRRDRRYPPHHCQCCGYSLIGNASGRCPECGEIV